MRRLFAALLLVVSTANAQEGFPLDGTWRGELSGSKSTVVLIMQWDGKTVSGTVNPGPNALTFTTAQLVPEGWHFTLKAADATGKEVSFDGAISDLGKYNRALTGKWTEGGRTHDVRFVHE
jgi:hypothetical protein